jgi:hypothetical protein
MVQLQLIQCRVAPSLGELEDTPQNIWGTLPYTNKKEPCVFFGLYDLRDYIALYLHKGKSYILWAGSDILNLKKGFVLNNGKLRWISKIPFVKRLIICLVKKSENWVENMVEKRTLNELGISTNICPSFLGNTDLPISYEEGKNVYVSCGKNRQFEYGWGIIERIAPKLPEFTFHLYGDKWLTKQPNVIVHGRVSKEQMNKEIKDFQIGLRLNEFDGFSEITAKAILQGHHAVTRVTYPLIPCFETESDLIEVLKTLKGKPDPYIREFYQRIINKYPWKF